MAQDNGFRTFSALMYCDWSQIIQSDEILGFQRIAKGRNLGPVRCVNCIQVILRMPDISNLIHAQVG